MRKYYENPPIKFAGNVVLNLAMTITQELQSRYLLLFIEMNGKNLAVSGLRIQLKKTQTSSKFIC